MNHIADFKDLDIYNRPRKCSECGGIMIFKGCGEYKCEKCRKIAYDDYGKVRNYVEKHRGATASQVSEATGVKQKTIRTMLKESRLEIADGSNSFMKCEMCGVSIRSGRVCSKCEMAYNRSVEENERRRREKMMAGFGMENTQGEEGAKRFIRDK
ncbi:MAG: flagellar operon protein YvyF [Lachnospiraceae bacterium]|nr:flagellar operon protein YvyF [Lachnospiraceae bacterium]